MKRENGRWTKPEVAPFSGRYDDGGPCLSPDGKGLYFYSKRPLTGNGSPKDADIWYMEKTGTSWGEPKNLGPPVNSSLDEDQPSVAASGSIYFRRENPEYPFKHCIYESRFVEGSFREPKPLEPPVNVKGSYSWCPSIAPDETFLLFASNRKNPDIGFGDLYISFKTGEAAWSEPVELGPEINSDDNDRFPRLSPDGRYLFFSSKRKRFAGFFDFRQSLAVLLTLYENSGNGLDDVYWSHASFIEELRSSGRRAGNPCIPRRSE